MESPISAPESYTYFQETMFYSCLLPVLDILRRKANGRAHMRDGVYVDDLPLHKSDYFRIHMLINAILEQAEDEFGIYVADAVAMRDIDGAIGLDYEDDPYYLICAEDQVRFLMMDDGCELYSRQDLPELTEENCEYYPFLARKD